MLCDFLKLVTSYKIGKVPFRLLGTNGFHAKAKNEILTAAGSRRRKNLKLGSLKNDHGNVFRNVTQRFRGALRDIPKDGCEGDYRLSDYVKKWHPKACRTYTTIRFHYLANEIVALPSSFPS